MESKVNLRFEINTLQYTSTGYYQINKMNKFNLESAYQGWISQCVNSIDKKFSSY